MRVKDPPCGTLVDAGETAFRLELRGKAYYFCSEYCQHHFANRPTVAYCGVAHQCD
jgi:YHS domain-containing protein